MPVYKELLAFDLYFIYTVMNDALHAANRTLHFYGTYISAITTTGTFFHQIFHATISGQIPLQATLFPERWSNFTQPITSGFEYDYFKVKKTENGWINEAALSNNSPVVISTSAGDAFANEAMEEPLQTMVCGRKGFSTAKKGQGMPYG